MIAYRHTTGCGGEIGPALVDRIDLELLVGEEILVGRCRIPRPIGRYVVAFKCWSKNEMTPLMASRCTSSSSRRPLPSVTGKT
jgi:hypothetical protein